MAVGYTNPTFPFTATATTSGNARINGVSIEALLFPATWTMANVTFQVSLDSNTWFDLYDMDAAQVVLGPVAGKAMMVPPGMLRGWEYLRLVSSVAQAAALDVTAVARRGG